MTTASGIGSNLHVPSAHLGPAALSGLAPQGWPQLLAASLGPQEQAALALAPFPGSRPANLSEGTAAAMPLSRGAAHALYDPVQYARHLAQLKLVTDFNASSAFLSKGAAARHPVTADVQLRGAFKQAEPSRSGLGLDLCEKLSLQSTCGDSASNAAFQQKQDAQSTCFDGRKQERNMLYGAREKGSAFESATRLPKDMASVTVHAQSQKFGPAGLKDKLGDSTFYTCRSNIIKQREQFLQNLWELNRAQAVQRTLCAEMNCSEHALTVIYACLLHGKKSCDLTGEELVFKLSVDLHLLKNLPSSLRGVAQSPNIPLSLKGFKIWKSEADDQICCPVPSRIEVPNLPASLSQRLLPLSGKAAPVQMEPTAKPVASHSQRSEEQHAIHNAMPPSPDHTLRRPTPYSLASNRLLKEAATFDPHALWFSKHFAPPQGNVPSSLKGQNESLLQKTGQETLVRKEASEMGPAKEPAHLQEAELMKQVAHAKEDLYNRKTDIGKDLAEHRDVSTKELKWWQDVRKTFGEPGLFAPDKCHNRCTQRAKQIENALGTEVTSALTGPHDRRAIGKRKDVSGSIAPAKKKWKSGDNSQGQVDISLERSGQTMGMPKQLMADTRLPKKVSKFCADPVQSAMETGKSTATGAASDNSASSYDLGRVRMKHRGISRFSGGFKGHSSAKSAAGILLSLSSGQVN